MGPDPLFPIRPTSMLVHRHSARFLIATSIWLGAAALCPRSVSSQESDDKAGQAIAWQVQPAATPRVVSGIVFGASGDRLHGAQVTLTHSNVGALTDEHGRFHLEAPSAGVWELQVQIIGHYAARDTIHVPDDAAVFVTAVLRYFSAPLCGNIICGGGSGCKDLNIVVVDSVTGAPPNALVQLRVEHEDSVWVRQFQMDTSMAHQGVGLGMPITIAGDYDIEVTAPGYQRWRRVDVALSLPDGCHPVLRNRRHMIRLVPTAAGTSSWNREAEENLIYAAVVDSLFGDSTHPAVVRRMTKSNMTREGVVESYWRKLENAIDVSAAMVADFEAVNSEPRRLTHFPTSTVRVLVAERATLDSLPRHTVPPPPGEPPEPTYWEAFRERFPGAHVLVVFTRPGFDVDRRYAVVNVDYGCGSLCGGGYIVTLRRAGKGWTIVAVEPTWVS